MLMTHYRQPIDLSITRLEQASAILDRWYRSMAKFGSAVKDVDVDLVRHLADDLNTPEAINVLMFRHNFATGQAETKEQEAQLANEFSTFLGGARLLGLMRLSPEEWSARLRDEVSLDNNSIDLAIAERLAALNSKDFKRADEIRAALLAEGIQLMDSKNAAGERVTTWEVKR
jgi:cysteinyl-tRNA synthetase